MSSTGRARSGLRPGLFLHRASRVERLALRLLQALHAQAPTSVLAPQRVVVAHPALGRWLLQACAFYRGAEDAALGIAANLKFLLPGEWQLELLEQLLAAAPERAAGYRREALRWRLHAALPAIDEAEVRHYLDAGQGDAELRRFQLADQLAALYTQYQVYRRDWLLAAERGEAQDWQARMWRSMVEQLGPGHRAQRMDAALRGLGNGQGLLRDQALHIFGVNHLAPDLLALIERLSRTLPVHLYVADPAPAVYWHDQPSGRARLRTAQTHEAERGHPLLTALGGLGQQLLLQLGRMDLRADNDEDEPDPSPAETTLARLQQGLRQALPATARHAGDADALLRARADDSLRIHACHTRLRELEVLRDALLHLLQRHPDVHPRDIVVMAPDIRHYAPLLPAVFGRPGRGPDGMPRALPWHLADRSLDSLHGLLAQTLELLDLPLSRITQSAVLSALDMPAVRQRFDLDDESVATLRQWLARSRVAWGLDAAMKAGLGAAAEHHHSFAHALDQLYLGLLSAGDEALAGFAGMAPLSGVADLQGPLLGALHALLAQLAEARAYMAQTHTLDAWTTWLRGWCDAMLAADPADPGTQEALDTLHSIIEAPRLAADHGEVQLSWSVIREVLAEQLSAQPQRQPFGRGGITFCGMVPARVIPFEFVAVLGLDDGVFPRQEPLAAGLNRIASFPRPGDRDVRSEDRYLFLETLLSARTALHLSYLGNDLRSEETLKPATPLAELIEHLHLETGWSSLEDAPWFLRHAQQPYATRYFDADSDPRYHSYSAQYARASSGAGLARPAFQNPASSAQYELPAARPLAALLRFLRQPAAAQMLDLQQISLQALAADPDLDDEPLQAAFQPLDQIDRRVFERAMRGSAAEIAETPPAWLACSGQFPSGLAGAMAWRSSRERINAALALVRQTRAPWQGLPPQRVQLRIAAPDDGPPLQGSVLLARGQTQFVLLESRIGRKAGLAHLLPLFARYAAARLGAAERPVRVALLHTPGQKAEWHPGVEAWEQLSPAELAHRLWQLQHLLERAARGAALWLFPRTAEAFVEAKPGLSWIAARRAWTGAWRQSGEANYQPPYAAWLARGSRFLDGHSAAARAFAAGAAELHALLDPGVRGSPT